VGLAQVRHVRRALSSLGQLRLKGAYIGANLCADLSEDGDLLWRRVIFHLAHQPGMPAQALALRGQLAL
jgi:hypothetical protein